MDEYVQFSAKTKNEAITKACIEMETSSDNLEIQVVREGTSGFLGFGSKPAIIKVRRKEAPEEEIIPEVEKTKPEIKKEEVKKEEKKPVKRPERKQDRKP